MGFEFELTNVGHLRYPRRMEAANIDEARTRLSQLVDLVERGEEVVIARRGRGQGIDRGRFEVPDDFDDPRPPEIMRHFT